MSVSVFAVVEVSYTTVFVTVKNATNVLEKRHQMLLVHFMIQVYAIPQEG